ncbi:MAG: UvrD-helicase domain-containing protein [Candidatus Pacebacteria bacterium]|nr:UvrD-helicase domain-containing protein [Candidatus Paceibacterota bacterium]
MDTQKEHLGNLNEKQREAALHVNGPLLIVAGAGAGKTKTITHRIINLIKEGISPDKILAVTFTNKAAKEMRERITTEMQRSISTRSNLVGLVPFVSTFHSLGVHIIKENAKTLGLTRYFTILDEGDSVSFIKDIIKEVGLDPKQYEPRKIKGIISREKGKFTQIGDYEARASDYLSKIVAQVWSKYESRKMKENSLDFDDLLLKSTKLLKDNEDIRKMYQDRWQYIHIDEYQDTNEVQYMMSKLLSAVHKNICVVGDADQNIYSWRGANLKNILSFEKDYPDTKIVLLEQNYRSTQNILEAANEIIKKNKYRPDKNLFTKNGLGEKISLYEALEENDEADFVATKILEIMDGKSVDLSEVAVLYRANFQSRALEEAMLRYNVPYQVLGVKFFERKEIKDTLAYLRAALNPENLSDIKRIINFPVRGIGKVTLAKIFAGEKDSLPIKVLLKVNNFYELLATLKEKIETTKTSEVIKFAVKHTGIERELGEGTDEDTERLENIRELATLALKYDALEGGKGIEKLLEDASLASDQDSIMVNEEKKEKIDAIKLMTVHASKGLEFKNVFITGLEDGLFPHERRGDTKSGEDAEEERRLFYVALTRAKEKLFLSFANFRTIFGSRQINAPSEFISDLPADLLEKEGEKGGIKTIYI